MEPLKSLQRLLSFVKTFRIIPLRSHNNSTDRSNSMEAENRESAHRRPDPKSSYPPKVDSHTERNPHSQVFVYDMRGKRKIKMPRGELYDKVGQTNIEKFPIKRKTKRITLSNNEEVVIPQNVRVKRWVGHFDTLYVVIVA